MEADAVASGVMGLDGDDAPEVAAASLASFGQSPLVVQVLMDRHRSPPPFTVEDAREVHVKEKLGGGVGSEHRGMLARLERDMRHAEEAGMPATTPIPKLTREHTRKVRDYMLSREKLGGAGRVSPASVKRELGLLRTVISYGAPELGLLNFDYPFDRLLIEGLSAATGRGLRLEGRWNPSRRRSFRPCGPSCRANSG